MYGFRYVEQAAKQARGWEIVKIEGSWQNVIKDYGRGGEQNLVLKLST